MIVKFNDGIGVRKITLSKWFLLSFFIYKIAIDFGYDNLLEDSLQYPHSFNLWHYIWGWICCLILFFGIRHELKKASTFFLYLVFLTNIIPITTIYAYANENSLFYSLTCAAFLLCEYLVGWVQISNIPRFSARVGKITVVTCVAAIFLMLGILYRNNGMPTLIALNIYDVYELRRSGWLQIGKFANYLFAICNQVFVPMAIAIAMERRKYFFTVLVIAVQVMFYLYSGHKTMLFGSVMSVSVCVMIYMIKLKPEKMWIIFHTVFIFMIFLCFIPNDISYIFHALYDPFVRRIFMVSAINKFAYYDYFCTHDLMGLAGVFPTWLLDFSNYYSTHTIGNIISAQYYQLPEMNSNTGFLAEGFMRFWYPGIFFELVLFAFILKLIDKFADRTSYNLCVCMFVLPIFYLNDGHLFDSLFFGSWMVIIMLVLLYGRRSSVCNGS